MTTTVHSYRVKPVPPGALWIGRQNRYHGGALGNPHERGPKPCTKCSAKYRMPIVHKDEEVKHLYKLFFFEEVASSAEYRRIVLNHRDKPLLCGCAKAKGKWWCHGLVIAGFLDSLPKPVTDEEVIAAARAELAKLAAEAFNQAEDVERQRKAAVDVE